MTPYRYETDCVERFLEYVKIDTQSSEESDCYPSTPGQLDLLRKLRDECLELGLQDVEMDENGYVFATVPATTAPSSRAMIKAGMTIKTGKIILHPALTIVRMDCIEFPPCLTNVW